MNHTTPLDHLLQAVARAREHEENQAKDKEVIIVSETISTAATAYELVRNALEYDEEHLLRRNAIRRILKRQVNEATSEKLASELLRELIWARYLPNRRVPERMGLQVASILRKYEPLFEATRTSEAKHRLHDWLLDALSTELEYTLVPPTIEEALASVAYQELKNRIKWNSRLVPEADRDLQLYTAVHRAILKSNSATLRFRLFTLYYPGWLSAAPEDPLVLTVAGSLERVVDAVEEQLRHPGAEPLYRLVRRHAIVFHVLRDLCVEEPDKITHAIETADTGTLDYLVSSAAKRRYDRFKKRLRTGVVRAVAFLFLTKMAIALIVEVPYEVFVLHEIDNLALSVNILFHPLLLAVLGISVRLPEEKNTKKILEEVHGLFGLGEDFTVVTKFKRPWRGALGFLFKLLYTLFFVVTVGVIVAILSALGFHGVSIVLFAFFFSLVTFFGLKIRNTKRELIVIESGTGLVGTVLDVLFLPLISAGRWVSLRAPRVNIFLFFFDFIIEAPFKAAAGLFEGWLAFLRDKKEEI